MRVRHGHNRARRGTLGEQVCFRGETAMSNIMQAAVVETLEKPHVLQEVPRASSRCDMPNIALLTRDGARFEFPCAQSDYILDAAAAANLYLPAICHEGTCGACHAHVGQGHFALGQIGDGALPDAPSGGVLLCRCRPEGDLVIDVPYPQADVHHQQIPRREATIVSLKPVDSSAVVLTIALTPDPALGTAADFTPGQYMEVWIPGTTICRAYSLANLPNWDGQLEFVIRLHEVTADLQDLLIYQLKGIGQYRTRLGALGRPDREADSIVLFDLFATLVARVSPLGEIGAESAALEQTKRTEAGAGCTGGKGVCGKDDIKMAPTSEIVRPNPARMAVTSRVRAIASRWGMDCNRVAPSTWSAEPYSAQASAVAS